MLWTLSGGVFADANTIQDAIAEFMSFGFERRFELARNTQVGFRTCR